MKITADSFTLEEINLIQFCQKQEKNAIITELKECLKYVGPDMAEIINATTGKLISVPDTEFRKLLDYPAEIFE